MSANKQDAIDYWKAQLNDAKKSTFPLATTSQPSVARVLERSILYSQGTSSFTKATILRAAWALVLARYSETNDITFGTTISGRQAPIDGITDMAGPAVATVPVRIRLDKQQTTSAFLKSVQSQAMEMISYEQFGLQNISKICDDAKEACDFTSLLVIQPVDQLVRDGDDALLVPAGPEVVGETDLVQNYFSYPLVIQGHLYDNKINLMLIYDSQVLSEKKMQALARHFDNAVQQLTGQGDRLLGAVSISSSWDYDQAIEFNQNSSEPVERCFHEMIDDVALVRGNALAISSWDACFTYEEISATTNRIAHYIVNTYGIEVGDTIHVCFEKSAWFMIAILAINKAGANWSALDPYGPAEYHRKIISQTGAKLIVASTTNSHTCADLLPYVLELTPELDAKLIENFGQNISSPTVNITPSDAAYVLFASESSDIPEGVVMEHASLCTSQMSLSHALDLDESFKVLQLSSYSSDAALFEICSTFLVGACLYVPSPDEQKTQLEDYIRKHNINCALLTPTVARTIRPDDVPSLDILLIGGEATTRDILDIWCNNLRLFNIWGPAECCVAASIHRWTSATESPNVIGRPISGSCWIVDPDDPKSMAPIGTVGEIAVQGRNLFSEYLSDPVKTATATIIGLPSWVPKSDSAYCNRFYLTGDLGFINEDGNLEYCTRKDSQIKVRGQRLELGEIEHHIQAHLEGVQQVAVDVIKSEAGTTLVAFISFSDIIRSRESDTPATGNDIFLPLDENLRTTLSILTGVLGTLMPRYMIPRVFIPCAHMPLNSSIQLDRKKLKHLANAFREEDIALYLLTNDDKVAPQTTMESQIQQLWAKVLNIPVNSIGRDDSFIQMGGDSILAIQLVSAARDVNIKLTVGNIFDDPRLQAVASKAAEINDEVQLVTNIEPFSLLESNLKDVVLSKTIQEQYDLPVDKDIEDAYPCTKLQEGLMALAVKQTGSYIAKFLYRLSRNVNVSHFKASWEETVRISPNLRTRIFSADSVPVQAIFKDDISWESSKGVSLRSYMRSAQNFEMIFGSRLSRYALIEDNGDTYFVLSMHHAIFDGWSLKILMEVLHSIFRNQSAIVVEPYVRFVQYTLDIDSGAAIDYWGSQLQGAKRTIFPSTTSFMREEKTKQSSTLVTEKVIKLPSLSRHSTTKATMLRAAWAIVLSRYSDSEDVTFGATISGRQASVDGLTNMAGPCIATVPVRIAIDRKQSISDFLEAVQSQANNMIPFEQFGLQNISKIGPDTKDACDFSSLLVVQPIQSLIYDDEEADALFVPTEIEGEVVDTVQNYFTYPLVIQGHMHDDYIKLVLIYDEDVLSKTQMIALSHQLETVMKQLASHPQKDLNSISITSDWDVNNSLSQNSDIPDIVDSCTHHLIDHQATIQPDALAIISWDRNFTYKQLNEASNRLAHFLVNKHGVKPDDLVHMPHILNNASAKLFPKLVRS
ncbi:nonribosomal peptide synthetase lcsA [Trichoderma asperellum]|uniref:Nonribosomal peptide synthetase lcsA n=1 Tax=Trichoderma asperellum TaxID=101201 RepID=A0A6V8QYF7_TRIAP|nr:nonribosomal peptide synthetase lcsA [Trichoderma asperellum]